MNSKKNLATHSFASYCFLLAIYLSVGSWVQYRYGLWGIVFNEVVLLLIPALIYTKILRMPFSRCYPFAWPTGAEILGVLLLTSVLIVVGEGVIRYQETLFPPPQRVQEFYQSLVAERTWKSWGLQIFALAVVPACCEEFFFRGYLQGLLRRQSNRTFSVLLVAALFAVAHMNPWYLSYYFVLGLYLSLLREWSDNLAWCILAHLMNNLYSLVFS